MAEIAKTIELTDERFLTFRSEGHFYALPAETVSEVARLPPIARVPQAPPSLMGLANLRGAVLPVASVRALLGRADVAATHASRLIVLEGASPVALVVDEVSSLVRIAPEKVKTAEADIASEGGEHLRGVFDSGSHVTKILDIPELLRRGFAQTAPKQQSLPTTAGATTTAKDAAVEMTRQRLVTFEVAGQDYALQLEVVREIVPAPKNLTFVPGSDDAVRGVMPYRGGLLPLLSLRRLLGLPSAILSLEKVLVVTIGDVLIGFVADRTRAVLSVDPDRVDPAPPVLAARAGGEAQIKEIYRAGQGKLVSILVPERLLREEIMQKLAQDETTMKPTDETRDASDAKELRFLIFQLDDNDFALPIDAVEEVARVPDQITRLPKTPKFLEGVVNLRGEVLPVVDQRRRFDMQATTVNANRRLVVLRTEQHRAGLIVDSVSEVLRCSPDKIKPSPDLTGDALGIVHSVINLEASGRIILLLDPSELLTRTERGLLDTFNKQPRSREFRQTKP
ncbi:chemotaxis protein CheW [Bradyrhizobium sp. JYMT SZCCT0428]|uniref:chemotaxis protein CheW n=1 Tax=Bradyrhizobium sp. JYMT SZCCT0428 TaxID=2807673 RepID=UPI001BA6DA8A|nr:chemotaxis protein CheW [Bradyrhizobium sp. JYMT SZCCT0428]MBR1150461.1 chemotaxis protein CheW [Bradyrhizobium sp. JYMT SZCCT0428]